jgi:hypothetical protein
VRGCLRQRRMGVYLFAYNAGLWLGWCVTSWDIGSGCLNLTLTLPHPSPTTSSNLDALNMCRAYTLYLTYATLMAGGSINDVWQVITVAACDGSSGFAAKNPPLCHCTLPEAQYRASNSSLPHPPHYSLLSVAPCRRWSSPSRSRRQQQSWRWCTALWAL